MIENTRRKVLQNAERRLDAAGIAHARRNAEWMLVDILGCTTAKLFGDLDKPVTEEQLRRFDEMLARRQRHEPLQYILGYTEFYGLRLAVTPAVLIPRPETEQVVEQALERIADPRSPRVLDVGTGSGCIGLAIKSECREATVWACDVSNEALQVARENAAINSLDVHFLHLDALSTRFTHEAPQKLDLLISNPPYVAEDEKDTLPRDVRDFEPHLALFAREDPLIFYRKLAVDGRQLLRSGGWLVVETHADYGREAEVLLHTAGFSDVELRRDLAGRSRILVGKQAQP